MRPLNHPRWQQMASLGLKLPHQDNPIPKAKTNRTSHSQEEEHRPLEVKPLTFQPPDQHSHQPSQPLIRWLSLNITSPKRKTEKNHDLVTQCVSPALSFKKINSPDTVDDNRGCSTYGNTIKIVIEEEKATYQVTGKDNFSTIADEVLDCRNGCSDSCIVCDILTVVQRHIQISPNEHLLSLEFSRREVSNALLSHRDNACNWFSRGFDGSELGAYMCRQKGISGGKAEGRKRRAQKTRRETKDRVVAAGETATTASSRASTPGSVLPSNNSKLAPPPVEIWLITSATPTFSTAATESPPPMIVVTPFPLSSANFFAIACKHTYIQLYHLYYTSVYQRKPFLSSQPHPMCLRIFVVSNASLNVLIESGPISNPIQPSGIADAGTICIVKEGVQTCLRPPHRLATRGILPSLWPWRGV
ncbi:hypothetical protein Ccrd_019323 [Cynara cardunculus var. scolymus]|uniref:Uncharacterized protein n=1 Tax=Cynara cardunculus var. scolymus TaxID=59895 RepID=A0A103Y4H0_CYNCS|nr:hypothetical protein Ccrd_019323 [Cynara cardunculus var. scolymus]